MTIYEATKSTRRKFLQCYHCCTSAFANWVHQPIDKKHRKANDEQITGKYMENHTTTCIRQRQINLQQFASSQVFPSHCRLFVRRPFKTTLRLSMGPNTANRAQINIPTSSKSPQPKRKAIPQEGKDICQFAVNRRRVKSYQRLRVWWN